LKEPTSVVIYTGGGTRPPDRAARLLTDAERIANSITDKGPQASALSRIAEALATTSS
jgi:hypothetical protein